MTSKKKQIQIFFNETDEQVFSSTLKTVFKEIAFLDDNTWEQEPKVANSIANCKSRFCYLWNKEIVNILPTIKRNDGKIQGPASGIVIQFQRCILDGTGRLLSGRLAVGYDKSDKSFSEFVNVVWSLIKKYACTGVYHVEKNGTIDKSKTHKEFIVGPNVIKYLIGNKISMLKDRSTENYYVPESNDC